MLNLVTQKRDLPQGILLRGLQPISGIDSMEKNRSQTGFNLSNGPGKLTQTLGITSKQLNLASIFDSALTMKIQRSKIPRRIMSSPRIHVSKRGTWTDKQLRFYVSGNPYVSEMNKSNIDYKNYGWI
ncbi:DNA-3-methyladenine glycosylase [Bombilactobacillus thymidiniphilus]|uniref:DNA-3-methyladenine glycosylase n=1 Tax=Bombilactobacillus thymidiniphilus TaxID=2923363 RepID=UPI0037C1742E